MIIVIVTLLNDVTDYTVIGPHLYLDKEGSMVKILVEKIKNRGPITIVGHAT